MRFKDRFLDRYLERAPLPLAFERSIECRLYQDLPLERPILDLGCGEGLFAEILFAEAIDTGVDPNRKELNLARSSGAYLELIECSGDSIPKGDSSYGTVFANSVLEHIPSLDPVLKEAHRLLRSGGRFYATVPSDRFERYSWMCILLEALRLSKLALRWRRLFNKFWHHHNVHTPEEWCNRFEQAGFRIESIREYDPRHVCVMNDALVPFSFPAFVAKRLFNRWSLVPTPARRVFIWPWKMFGRKLLLGAERADRGGLVFLEVTKP